MPQFESLNVVFMGTSRFAVPSLEALVEDRYRVVAVFSQPPRPAGRGRRLTSPPVVEAARRLGLRVLTPEKLRAPETVDELERLHPDLVVVAAYAQFLPKSVLQMPGYGCINIHASLLPRWRGASPIQAALLAGDEFTGITLMNMEPTMDTGPILAQSLTRIQDSDAAPQLEDRLSRAGGALLSAVLPCYLQGAVTPLPQDAALATYAQIIHKEDGLIDWSQAAVRIWRTNRAFTPWPGSFTHWKGRLFRIVSCRPEPGFSSAEAVGTVLPMGEGKAARVITGDGALELLEVALEGGHSMGIREFLAGHKEFIGSRLGEA